MIDDDLLAEMEELMAEMRDWLGTLANRGWHRTRDIWSPLLCDVDHPRVTAGSVVL